MPTGGYHHLLEEPFVGQEWHSDGVSGGGYEIQELQCYYYPEDVNLEDGPTIVLPGSHCRAVDSGAIGHHGDFVGQVPLIVKAGTVALTRYGIWHRGGPKLSHTRRSMVKCSFFRQARPQRDWLIDSPEVPEYVDRPHFQYMSEIETYRDICRRLRTWNWLCGIVAHRLASARHLAGTR